jgi:two-component system, NarL family, nitrate/nitrite response regulator NarL
MTETATVRPEIRLMLIDDHTLFREGLARLLEGEPGLRLVGHFASTAEALASPELSSVQVALLDFDLGEEQGTRFLRESLRLGFMGRTLMVTAGMSGVDAVRALEGGASGIFLKHNPPASLIAALHRVAAGQPWLDAGSFNSLVQAASNNVNPQPALALTQRERAVLKGVFEGLTNKEIAAELAFSESYVKALLQQLFAKTRVRTRSQLVRVALERHLA